MTLTELAQLIKDTMEEMEYQMNKDKEHKEKYIDQYLQIGQLMDEIETIISDVCEKLNDEEL